MNRHEMHHGNLTYRVDVIIAPRRDAPHAAAAWCTPAHVTITCLRCVRWIEFVVAADELQKVDPHNNHLLSVFGDSYVRMTPTGVRAVAAIRDHLCWPLARQLGVDVNATTHEQYEALSQVFAKLAMEAR